MTVVTWQCCHYICSKVIFWPYFPIQINEKKTIKWPNRSISNSVYFINYEYSLHLRRSVTRAKTNRFWWKWCGARTIRKNCRKSTSTRSSTTTCKLVKYLHLCCYSSKNIRLAVTIFKSIFLFFRHQDVKKSIVKALLEEVCIYYFPMFTVFTYCSNTKRCMCVFRRRTSSVLQWHTRFSNLRRKMQSH